MRNSHIERYLFGNSFFKKGSFFVEGLSSEKTSRKILVHDIIHEVSVIHRERLIGLVTPYTVGHVSVASGLTLCLDKITRDGIVPIVISEETVVDSIHDTGETPTGEQLNLFPKFGNCEEARSSVETFSPWSTQCGPVTVAFHRNVDLNLAKCFPCVNILTLDDSSQSDLISLRAFILAESMRSRRTRHNAWLSLADNSIVPYLYGQSTNWESHNFVEGDFYQTLEIAKHQMKKQGFSIWLANTLSALEEGEIERDMLAESCHRLSQIGCNKTACSI